MIMAIDLGLRFGVAVYDGQGRLVRYGSQHIATRGKLKRAIYGILRQVEGLELLVLEGDRALAELWARAAEKQGVEVIVTSAEVWREVLLIPRERRSGAQAKASADTLAREIIERSGAPKPTALRHDAAEAIAIGWWAVRQRAEATSAAGGLDGEGGA